MGNENLTFILEQDEKPNVTVKEGFLLNIGVVVKKGLVGINGTIKISIGNKTLYESDYLNNTDLFIGSSNVWIGIKLGNENITLNLNGNYNASSLTETTGHVHNLAAILKAIKGEDGTLTISIGNKTYQESVSGLVGIISFMGVKPYLLLLNGTNML
ncbi:unnamed protein product [Gordionus sp. m RMFG-2023]